MGLPRIATRAFRSVEAEVIADICLQEAVAEGTEARVERFLAEHGDTPQALNERLIARFGADIPAEIQVILDTVIEKIEKLRQKKADGRLSVTWPLPSATLMAEALAAMRSLNHIMEEV